MKYLIKINSISPCKKNGTSLLNKNHPEKILVNYQKFRELNEFSLLLKKKKVIYSQKTQLRSMVFNSLQNIENLNGLWEPLTLNYTEMYQIDENIVINYPLRQFLSNFSIDKIEVLGWSYFSLIFIKYQKIYYELILSKNPIFPSLILTNSMVVSRFEGNSILSPSYNNHLSNYFQNNFKKSLSGHAFKFENLYQCFLLEKIVLKLLEKGYRFLIDFFNTDINVCFFLNPIKPIHYISSKRFGFGFNNSKKEKNIFEINKISRKSFKRLYHLDIRGSKELIFHNNKFSLKLKTITSKPDYLFLTTISYTKFIYSNKNLKEITPVVDRIFCSILISSSNISKISQILKNIKYKRLTLKIYHFEKRHQFNFKNLIDFIDDFKRYNNRLILIIGQPVDNYNLNFICSIIILPRFQCLKIFCGLYQFSQKIGKNFFIKKCLEKKFIFFPISILIYSNIDTINFNSPSFKTKFNFQFQKKFPDSLRFVEDLIYLSRRNSSKEFRSSVDNFILSRKTFHRNNNNKILRLVFYYSFVTNFREILLSKKIFMKKQQKQFFFQFLYFWFTLTCES